MHLHLGKINWLAMILILLDLNPRNFAIQQLLEFLPTKLQCTCNYVTLSNPDDFNHQGERLFSNQVRLNWKLFLQATTFQYCIKTTQLQEESAPGLGKLFPGSSNFLQIYLEFFFHKRCNIYSISFNW